MTYGMFAILVAFAVELSIFAYWLRFVETFPTLASRRWRHPRFLVILTLLTPFGASATLAGLLSLWLAPIATRNMPGELLLDYSPLLALWTLAWGRVCCEEIANVVSHGPTIGRAARSMLARVCASPPDGARYNTQWGAPAKERARRTTRGRRWGDAGYNRD